jgi:hypothetical protein
MRPTLPPAQRGFAQHARKPDKSGRDWDWAFATAKTADRSMMQALETLNSRIAAASIRPLIDSVCAVRETLR